MAEISCSAHHPRLIQGGAPQQVALSRQKSVLYRQNLFFFRFFFLNFQARCVVLRVYPRSGAGVHAPGVWPAGPCHESPCTYLRKSSRPPKGGKRCARQVVSPPCWVWLVLPNYCGRYRQADHLLRFVRLRIGVKRTPLWPVPPP